MAILHSCCWWRSVRRGAFASVIYTILYFGCSCMFATNFLLDERLYLTGESDVPVGESFLEKEKISVVTIVFSVLAWLCSSGGLFASVLAIVGLKYDRRTLLVPWISAMVFDILVEFAHCIYLFYYETLHFEPLTATLFTIDLFIVTLNFYCLLCVVSQYQELRAGRGGARHDHHYAQHAQIQYVPSTQTSYPRPESSTPARRTSSTMDMKTPVAATTTTTSTTTSTSNHKPAPDAPNGRRANGCKSVTVNETTPVIVETSKLHENNAACADVSRIAKKHVQFPDELRRCTCETPTGRHRNRAQCDICCPSVENWRIAAPDICAEDAEGNGAYPPPAYGASADWSDTQIFDDII